jgi:glycosyltransferase involved in cell wall biosynthesis
MRILFLSFYFEPDLCAGSFRNTPLVKKIAEQLPENGEVVVITTKPNRYKSYSVEALSYEARGKIKIHRIDIPTHNSGMKDQIKSFYTYYRNVLRISKKYKFDLVYASSSRLFTAYLGHKISERQDIPYYVDVRDIFVDTMEGLLTNKLIRFVGLPVLKLIESTTFKKATHINLISEGFHSYFREKYTKPTYSFFSNGIDDLFLKPSQEIKKKGEVFKIVYAGNIGEGQGLEKIIPLAAKSLSDQYQFEIYGGGGAENKLKNKIKELQVTNVKINKPVSRDMLLDIYAKADFLFLHLNNFKAFEKVLPSKLFEYGACNIPIIAGVNGFSREFILKNMKNTLVFEPCNHKELVKIILNYDYKKVVRLEFIERFKRSSINSEMAKSIANIEKYL